MKTIVCGSTFGQYYLSAFKLLQEDFEVVGLLAKGSERSRNCAAYYGIPIMTEISEIPDDTKLACVVLRSDGVGGNGTELTLQLLERGIHVIQEHPIYAKVLTKCYKNAVKNNKVFRIGNFYSQLLEVKRFIKCAQEMNQLEKLLYIRVSFCIQSSYSVIGILMQALPNARNWKMERYSETIGPFQIALGSIGGTPAVIENHNQINPEDPDGYMHLLHSIEFLYESGRLALEDTFGPVTWKPRIGAPKENYNNGYIEKDFEYYSTDKSYEILGDYQNKSIKEILSAKWPDAIAEDIKEMRCNIRSGNSSKAIMQQETLCAKQWQELSAVFGFAEFINETPHKNISTSVLQEAAGVRNNCKKM